MDILQKIEIETKEAMKKGEAIRLRLLRALRSALHNAKIAKQAVLEQADVFKVIQSELKKRKEAIEAYVKAGREQLAKEEQEEAAVLESYMPQQMTDEEIDAVVASCAAELGVTDAKGFGQLMGAVMKKVGSNANGDRVRALVQHFLKP